MRRHCTPEAAARFWSNVDRGSGCWLWTGSRRPNGYGRLGLDYQTVSAHRFSWELANGPIPDGLFVLHRCDTPACVRPDHLFLGTQADNMADKVAKGRQATGASSGRKLHPERWPVGEQHHSAKLTDDDVRRIRADHAVGASTYALARRYGMDKSSIGAIVKRKTWTHIE